MARDATDAELNHLKIRLLRTVCSVFIYYAGFMARTLRLTQAFNQNTFAANRL
jgi:hypothetical protein